jgi:PHP family Zn ribbon phosphoesterase
MMLLSSVAKQISNFIKLERAGKLVQTGGGGGKPNGTSSRNFPENASFFA